MVEDAQVIQDFLNHSERFVEKPHPAFNGFPVCPFARACRLENHIEFLVIPALGAQEEEIFRAAQSFAAQSAKEILLILYKDRAIDCAELYQYIAGLNERFRPLGLEAFGGHPQDEFNVQGLHTRRGPWPNFQVIQRSLAMEASRSLWNTSYYRNWTPEQLRQNGLPRHDVGGAGG